MHCTPWLGYDDAILAHSRYADENYDSAMNSSLRYVTEATPHTDRILLGIITLTSYVSHISNERNFVHLKYAIRKK